MDDDFLNDYEIGEIIDRGVNVVVKKCTHTQSGETLALKTFQLEFLDENQCAVVVRDIGRLDSLIPLLQHPLICYPVQTFIQPHQAFILQHIAEGPDLCLEIVNRAESGFVYSEAVASHYMKQVLEAVRHIHSQGVVHRNITTNNICLANHLNSASIKLDGLMHAISVQQLEKTKNYVIEEHEVALSQLLVASSPSKFGDMSSSEMRAPEMQQKEVYGKAVDVWSVGCFLHLLLFGLPPSSFQLNDVESPLWNTVSQKARDLLKRMMEEVPSRRLSAEEALEHPWIKERSQVPKTHMSQTVRNMALYNKCRVLKNELVSLCIDPYWSIPSNYAAPDPDIQSKITYDLKGLETVLETLDGSLYLQLSSSPSVFQHYSEHFTINSLLHMFESINGRMPYFLANQHPDSLFLLFNELHDGCETDALEPLRRLFINQPHLAFLLKTHDMVARQLNKQSSQRLVESFNQSGSSIRIPNGNNDSLTTNNNKQPQGCNNSTIESCNSGTLSGNSMERVARVRLVQFHKDPHEPLGVTLKRSKTGRVLVSRVIDNGMMHRQGILRVGDEIEEVNGIKLQLETIDNIQRILKECQDQVSFKVIQASRNQTVQAERYVRALFSYDPFQDPFIPSPEAGLSFHTGDVLKIVDISDEKWWQARLMEDGPHMPAKLIPSLQQQEDIIKKQDLDKKRNNRGSWWRRRHKEGYLLKHNSIFDQLEINSYEEVLQLPNFQYKTLVLLGAHGVGRRHIKNLFINNNPHKYAYPIPHTTREARRDEEHGRNYFFVSREQMTSEINENLFLEYGTHEGHLYGTKLSTIKQIHQQGLVAILDIEPQALKILRTAEYAPYVVFVAVPNDNKFLEDDALRRLLSESDLLQQTYGHFFNLTIVNNDIDDTIEQLQNAMRETTVQPQWIPVKWVY